MNFFVFALEIFLVVTGIAPCQRGSPNCGFASLEESTTSMSRETLCGPSGVEDFRPVERRAQVSMSNYRCDMVESGRDT